MGSYCIVHLPDGGVCGALAVVVDEPRGGLVCVLHAPPSAVRHDIPYHPIRRAMQHPDRYLAAALAEWTDEWIVAELGCPQDRVWRLRLAGWPRMDQWERDVRTLARAVNADPELLAGLLRRVPAGSGSNRSRLG